MQPCSRVHCWIRLACLAILALTSVPASASTGGDTLVSASSRRHLWLVLPRQSAGSKWQLLHHAVDMKGDWIRVAADFTSRPMALAARDDRVWVVFDAESADHPRREVVTLRTSKNQSLDHYFTPPTDGVRLLPSLSPTGSLLDLIGTTRGPVALLLGADEPGASLLRLEHDGWVPLPLPESTVIDESARLFAMDGPGRFGLITASSDGDHMNEFAWNGSGYDSTRYPVSSDGLVGVATSQGRLGLLKHEGDAGRYELGVPRSTGLLRLATLEAMAAPWSLGGTDPGFVIMEVDSSTDVTLTWIDPVNGDVGTPVQLEPQPLGAGDWIHMPLLGALVICLGMALLLLRPVGQGADSGINTQLHPFPLSRRAVALCIDLLPGAILAMLILDVPPQALLQMPLWTINLDDAMPGTLLVAITMLHSTCGELLMDRTVGKILMGGGVVNASNGARAERRQLLVRNSVKTLVLLAPVLGLFVLISPFNQGVPETVSRTLVIDRKQPPSEQEEPSDQS